MTNQIIVQPKIQKLAEKKLVGVHMKMSIADDKTAHLWRHFGPLIKSIKNRVSQEKISMQLYDGLYFQAFDPHRTFEKWATVEVEHFDEIPDGLSPFILPEGLYAVFSYKGSSSDTRIYQYIYNEWLAHAPYQLADRPHFEILGEKYKPNDPTAEEEIWIPITAD